MYMCNHAAWRFNKYNKLKCVNCFFSSDDDSKQEYTYVFTTDYYTNNN